MRRSSARVLGRGHVAAIEDGYYVSQLSRALWSLAETLREHGLHAQAETAAGALVKLRREQLDAEPTPLNRSLLAQGLELLAELLRAQGRETAAGVVELERDELRATIEQD